MDKARPNTIDKEVWERARQYLDEQKIKVSFLSLVLRAIKLQIILIINDFKMHNNLPRYLLFYCQNPDISWNMLDPDEKEDLLREIPALKDLKEDKYLYIDVVKNLPSEVDAHAKKLRLFFTLRGEISSNSIGILDNLQIQDVSKFLVTLYDELREVGKYEDIYTNLENKEPVKRFTLGKSFKSLLLENSDYDLIPEPRVFHERETELKPEPWTKIKAVPKLSIQQGVRESCWAPPLIGSTGMYLIGEDMGDQAAITPFFLTKPAYEIIRPNGSFGDDCLKSLLESIDCFVQGSMKRGKIDCDKSTYGIGYKKLKRKIVEGPWERANFPIEREDPPTWMEEELEELFRKTDTQWIELENLPTYTELDRCTEEGIEKFLEIVSDMVVMGQIEKWVSCFSRISTEINSDREKITLVPITTRKKMRGRPCCQIWGFVGIGPHHPRQDSDKIPMVTLQFCGEDNPKQYRKFSYGKLIGESFGIEGRVHFLGRITPFSKYKAFYYSGMRKTLLQPCEMFSKILLEHASDKGVFERDYEEKISIFIKDTYTTIPSNIWIKKLLCLEFVMAVNNDSQMEGFLGNIRRLQMARHALSERREVYCPVGGNPQGKVEECVINNAAVLHLASSWNSLPNAL